MLRDFIDECNACEINIPSNECFKEHNWIEHPELFCKECNHYMLHIDDLVYPNNIFFCSIKL